MIRGIDHLVIAVDDPDRAADELAESVGLEVSSGGRHPDAGTFNRLCWLADGAYIELLGVEDARLAAERPLGAAALEVLAAGGGLCSYALVDDEIETTVARLRANGSAIGEPVAGTRQRPDGELVRWTLALPPRLGPEEPPFVIHHPALGAEWGPEAVAARRSFRHPIGSPVSLHGLDLAVLDPPSLAATYAEQLGIEFWAVADLAVVELGTHVLRLLPRSRVPVRAQITLSAEVELARAADLLGVRFAVERADVAHATR